MRIPKVDKLEDAEKYVAPFYLTRGIFYSPLEKQVRDVFKGISEPSISYFHYKNNYSDRSFFKQDDLDNLFVWVAFDDDTIIQASELYKDEQIAEVINNGTLTKEIIIKSDFEWDNPTKIIRGLDLVIFFNEPGGHFEAQWKDIPDGIPQSRTIEDLNQRERINLRYSEYFKDMKTPTIRFRAKNTIGSEIQATLQFLTL